MKILKSERYTGYITDYYQMLVSCEDAEYHVTYDLLTQTVNVHEWYLLDEEALECMKSYVKALANVMEALDDVKARLEQ